MEAALPYLLGRITHGYSAIGKSRTVPREPGAYFRKLYFDTIVHDPRMLLFLYELVGADRLMLGDAFLILLFLLHSVPKRTARECGNECSRLF